MASGSRLRELLAKYGQVAVGVHFSVSAVSIAGLYVAIKNNVDVEALLGRIGLSTHSKEQLSRDEAMDENISVIYKDAPTVNEDAQTRNEELQTGNTKNEKPRASDFLASGGGALALALLCNKALLPVRVPITVALTPPVARFLARRRQRVVFINQSGRWRSVFLCLLANCSIMQGEHTKERDWVGPPTRITLINPPAARKAIPNSSEWFSSTSRGGGGRCFCACWPIVPLCGVSIRKKEIG